MRIQISIRPKMLLFSLVMGIVLVLISFFLFLRLDDFIHNRLYEFGLQFSLDWAEQYWIYARVILGLLGLTAVANYVSAAYIQVGGRMGISLKSWAIGIPVLIGIVASAVSTLLFLLLDHIVHDDLYRFGLQFSYLWANQYWAYARLMLGLIELAILINCVSIGYVAVAHFAVNVTADKLMTWLLLTSGVAALMLSVIYESSISAFIGLGLIFWGATMLYVRPRKSVQERILATMISPSLVDLDQMMKSLGYKGKAVYLPPKYITDFDSSKVYISAEENLQLPTPEQIEKQQESLFLDEPKGILLTPIGAELNRLFEKTLGTSFTKVNLRYIMLNMPKVIIEDLEIARNFEMEAKNCTVRVKIEGLVYKGMYAQAGTTLNTHSTIDHPISSAIACALAKATGKPIIIEKEQTSEDGKTIDIEYCSPEEPPQ